MIPPQCTEHPQSPLRTCVLLKFISKEKQLNDVTMREARNDKVDRFKMASSIIKLLDELLLQIKTKSPSFRQIVTLMTENNYTDAMKSNKASKGTNETNYI